MAALSKPKYQITAITMAGPMVKGLSQPKIMDIARLAMTTSVIHSSRGQRRTDSPNRSSTRCLVAALERYQQPTREIQDKANSATERQQDPSDADQ